MKITTKIFVIAWKDLLHSFRSTFALVFMFGIPLMVTGMFYLMFGNPAADEKGQAASSPLAQASVMIANLDDGDLGESIAASLQSPELAGLLAVSFAADAEAARAAVDQAQADAAVILPADLTARFNQAGGLSGGAVIQVYGGAEAQLGAQVVQMLLAQASDRLSGARIALAGAGPGAESAAAQRYAAEMLAIETRQQKLVEMRSPQPGAAAETPQADDILRTVIGPIMGGMLIFFAFFTAVSTAQTILREDEEGTLARLFSTPTPQAAILAGKFLSVFLTVLVQVLVLLAAARLLFQIEWGKLSSVALAAVGIILPATAFGILFNALLKNTRQGGALSGGVLTVTGMVGMFTIFTGGASSPAMEIASLCVPQGWAVRGLLQAMNGAPASALGLTLLVCLAWSAVFFGVGAWRFQKRFS